MKVALVVVYIGLGYFALGRAKTRRVQVVLWLLALVVFGYIYSVARAHHPLGSSPDSAQRDGREPT